MPLTSAGFDFCAADGTALADVGSRDSGASAYTPIDTSFGKLLGVNVPVYRDGANPTTDEGRREAFVGWVGTVSVPQVLLKRALQSHPEMAVSMRYQLNGSDAEFSSGDVPKNAETVTIDLHNGWTVTTFGPPTSGGLLEGSPLVLLLVGHRAQRSRCGTDAGVAHRTGAGVAAGGRAH